jgi:predicted transcriptional regulator of viral defense system
VVSPRSRPCRARGRRQPAAVHLAAGHGGRARRRSARRRPQAGGGIRHAAEILAGYLDDHDAPRLIEYGDRLGNGAVFKRLGYLVEALGREEPELVAACQERLPVGIALLDPDARRDGPRVPRWGIRANVRVGPESPS